MTQIPRPSRGKPPTAKALRVQLAQAEQQLREMKEESSRVAAQHSRELDILLLEKKSHQEKLERIRMEECMAPEDLEAICAGNGQSSAPAIESRLLVANNAKYQAANAMIQRKRAEAMEAASNLKAMRQHLAELQQAHLMTSSAARGSVMAAARTDSRVAQYQSEARERLRVLEVHVSKESKNLSMMMQSAKSVRSQIETYLIAQSHFEQKYREHKDDLLDKKKEMSFLREICILIFEEREQKLFELQQLRSLAKKENEEYERSFDELKSVLTENARVQEANKEEVARLKKSIQTSRDARIALQAQNGESYEKLQRQAARRGSVGATLAASGNTSEPNEVADQIEDFESFFRRLADIVDSPQLEDVVNFLPSSAEDHFRLFSELNHVKDQIKTLQIEKKHVLESLAGPVVQRTPEEEAAAVASIAEAKLLQETLKDLRMQTAANRQSCEKLDALVNKVVGEVAVMFKGLGCDIKPIQESTGMDKVLSTTLSESLAMVDQRTDEYLLALARRSQETADASNHENKFLAAARPVLHRADLLKKNCDAARNIVAKREMPRSRDSVAIVVGPSGRRSSHFGDAPADEGPLTQQQMRSLVEKRCTARDKKP